MKLEMLKVINVSEIKTDKRGRNYQTVKFQKYSAVAVGNNSVMVASDLVGTRNFHAEFTDTNNRVWAADAHFGNITNGMMIAGTIQTVNTTPYLIGENKVTKYKAVLLEKDFADIISAINQQLKQHNACVVDEMGTLTQPDNLKKSEVTVAEEEA